MTPPSSLAPLPFPALFRCADAASRRAQKRYLLWVRINLALLILGALVGALNADDLRGKRILQSLAAGAFIAALASSLLIATRRWERLWYATRALAESAKSLSWKFVAGVDPFPATLPAADVARHFARALHDLVHNSRHLPASLAPSLDEPLPRPMLDARSAPIPLLRDLYLAQRIDNQHSWYAGNAIKNRRHRRIWFLLVILFHLAAILAALWLIVDPLSPWHLAALFSTIASAILAWGQVKRFEELALAYARTAHELSRLSAHAATITTQPELSALVTTTESTLSHEYTTWLTHRSQ
jgi:hypothetical protein